MGFGASKRWLGACTAVAALLLVCAPAFARDAVEPYGAHDARGFRNILPPGEAGTDNAAQLAQFEATGDRPKHWTDQQPLYDRLIQG